MAGSSAGSIQLDLELNRSGFDRQLSGIGDMAKKAGMAIAAAFSVKALIDFGKSCVDLGSQLAEVQNVVDVTFTSMSAQVDKFAKDAAVNFGLSETMAKQYMGTIGAMSKSLGFSEKAAYDMSEGIASLAGDVASFYNISQDSAFDKLQSIFTGTLMPLREFGINMSQAALQEYALRNGITKSMDAMSEQEKVMLRYKFVMDGLKGAQGDFLRTSDGWANQIRVLKLQFDSLKATIGQGLINVLLPVVKMINGLIGRVMSLANAFKAFTDLLSGGKSSASASVSKAAGDMGKMEQAAGGAGKALGGAGGAAKKAAKDIASATTGIDELNIINKPDSGDDGSSGDGGGSGGGGSDYGADDFDMGALSQGEGVVDSFGEKIKGLIAYAKELAGLFKEGFAIGFGDTSVIDDIQNKIRGIGKSILDIFSNTDVQKSADNFMKSLALNLGKSVGSIASIGATIALNLLGGLDKYLDQNKEFIQQHIVNMLDISARGMDIFGNFMVAIADIFTVFRSDQAQQLTADLIGIFANSFLGLKELCMQVSVDILNIITAPFINNVDGIKSALNSLLGIIGTVVGQIKELVDYFFTGLTNTYNAHFKPLADALAKGFTDIGAKGLEMYDKYLRPVLEQIGPKFTELSETHLKPLIDRFMEFFGKVADGIKEIWEKVLQPFIEWFIANVAPLIGAGLKTVIEVFSALATAVADVMSGVLKALGGLIDFISGVFTGDWKKAWEGIKTFFSGIWDAMKAIATTVLNLIKTVIDNNLKTIKSVWDSVWGAIKLFIEGVWNGIKSTVTNSITAVKTGIDTALNAIKSAWDTTWNSIKTTTVNIWNGIWGAIKGVINMIIGGIEGMVNGCISAINSLVEGINDLTSAIPGGDSISIPTMSKISLPKLAQGGYVRANTPQLAMIGDNKYQGEVVAPEGKLLDMARLAAEMSSQSRDNQTNERILTALEKIADLIETLDLTVNLDNKEIARSQREYSKRLGFDMT
jgi:phage-related protein